MNWFFRIIKSDPKRIYLIWVYLIAMPLIGHANESMGETIVYNISPAGTSSYNDQGLVQWQGKQVNKTIFRTQVMGFDDTETIYSDPINSLPLRVERNIKWPLSKEYIIEEYNQQNFTYSMKKYKGEKVVEQNNYTLEGPIHNAILLPFYLRKISDLQLGWTYKASVPKEFIITLSSIEDITVPAGTFKAYHFTSNPDKFEIWISQDERRLPIQIKGLSGFNYTMSMKTYSPGTTKITTGK